MTLPSFIVDLNVLTTTAIPTTTTSASDDDNVDYTLLICGITVGVFLIVSLMLLIMILAYCHFCMAKSVKPIESVSYNKFDSSTTS